MQYILLCWLSQNWPSGFEIIPSVLKVSVMAVIALQDQSYFSSLKSLFSSTSSSKCSFSLGSPQEADI